MELRTLLIADSSEDFLLAITALLQHRFRILICQDGNTALNLLHQHTCDLLILDLTLPELDGLSLLETAVQEGCCPPVLALTPLLNDYVLLAAQRLGIRYLIRKPCDIRSVAARAEDILHAPALPTNRQFLSQLLQTMGIAPNLAGYHYLMECTLRFAARPDQAFTKELYPSVGKLSQHTGPQVERSIRSALDGAWNYAENAVQQQYFPGFVSRPTSSECISRLAEVLRNRQGEYLDA